MNNKGFTLVELMAVIIVLCLIMLVGVPSMSKTIDRQTNRSYDEYIKNICYGAKNYARHYETEYKQLYETGNQTSVCLNVLYEKGYVSDKLVNPDTDSRDTGVGIVVKRDSNGIDCEKDVKVMASCH